MQEKNQEKEMQPEQEVVDDAEQELVDEESQPDSEIGNEEVEQLKQEKEELQDRLLRLQADYDNFRKRNEKEKEANLKYRSQQIVSELLPVVDNFERALKVEVKEESTASFVEGIEMVYRQLKDALKKEGVEDIKTEGETFDPHVHQAVMQVEDDQYESNVVIEELQKGYKLKDRIIRPAMVKVNQ